MKDKMIKAALSFAVLCGLGACTKNYLDINSNPYEVDKEQMEAKDYAIASGLSAMFWYRRLDGCQYGAVH